MAPSILDYGCIWGQGNRTGQNGAELVYNGNFNGATQPKSVYLYLENAVKNASSFADKQKAIKQALAEIAEILNNGQTFRYLPP